MKPQKSIQNNDEQDMPQLETGRQIISGIYDDEAKLGPGLAGKLLILTIIFVMLAEMLIFVPSVANFRNVWLQNCLNIAEAASIVYFDAPDAMLSLPAQKELLRSTNSIAVVLQKGDVKKLMTASSSIKDEISYHIDLTSIGFWQSIEGAVSTLLFGDDKLLRVTGNMKDHFGTIELVQNTMHLRNAMFSYLYNIMLLSLVISLITATLLFLALYIIIVHPIKRISSNMTAFSRQPENADLIFQPTSRQDEIGIAEKRLASFERDLQNTLRQKQRLADLGLAVSKINHDLRNILASALLFSDRLSSVSDPTVTRFLPKLIKIIDRAVEYTNMVLYGKAVEKASQCRLHRLHPIAEDAAELLGIDQNPDIGWINEIPEDLEINVDAEQLSRVFINLLRNSIQAMHKNSESHLDKCLKIKADRNGDLVMLRIIDTGPGIPEKSKENLFQPFEGSMAPGGTGLGLAITMELIEAHGGMIELESSSSEGTVFLISLPDMKNHNKLST